MQKPDIYRFIVSGGGTGGHIFPAIAIANSLKELHPNAEILFVGAKGKMEMEKVPKAGYKIKGLWISGIDRKLSLRNLLFPFKLIASLFQCLFILAKFRPACAIGVGGYASGPLLFMAQFIGVPTVIQEQNAFPGITNKILARKVKRAYVAWDNMSAFFKKDVIINFGNPVRVELFLKTPERAEAARHFNLDPTKKTILVTGGSQGALGINMAIAKNIEKIIKEDTQLLWQCGSYYKEIAEKLVANLNSKHIQLHVFIDRMDFAFACSDLVISRAGASIISELALALKPSIFVPLPTAAEDHQTKNAAVLVEKCAAQMVVQSEANNKLVPQALELLSDNAELNKLKTEIKQFAKPNAALDIAKDIIKLINPKA